MYTIKLKRKNNSMVVKHVTRNVSLKHVGRRGPKGDKGDPGDAANAPVQSVNAKTGDVVLNKSDIGLGNVDNTSDLSKPISTATQSALDLKANISSLALVATSGSYNDLSDKPTIPDISNLVPNTRTVNGYPLSSNVTLSKSDIGLSNVDNTSDANKPVSTATQAALNAKANDTEVVHNTGNESIDGIKAFTSSPTVPTPILDEDAANLLYVLDQISPLQAQIDSKTGEITGDAHIEVDNVNFPSVSLSLVGFENVDNTSDINKPISSATQAALDAKENTITAGTTAQYYRGDKTFQTLDKTAVGLSNVDNTSDANKPVSTAQQTALNLKANDNAVVHLTGNETVAGIKTFSSSPIVPTPTTGLQATTKDYADKIRTNQVTVARSGMADYVCDGVADDVQIQAAIDAVASAGGGTVFIRANTNPYRIATTLVMAENVTLFGERMARQSAGGVTLKTAASVTLTDLLQVTGTSNPSSNANLKHDTYFENITFDGNNTTTNNVKLTNQDTSKFVNCRFIQSTNSLVTVWDSTVAPTAATIPGGVYMERCNVSPASGGIGIHLEYQTQCWFTNCWFTPPSGTPAAMMRIKSSNKIYVDGPEFNTATTAIILEDVNTGGGLDFPCHNIAVYAKTFNTGGTVLDDNRTHANSGRLVLIGTTAAGTSAGDAPIGSGNVVLIGASNALSDDLTVPDEAYGVGWNGNLEVPTKNALYDKIETLGGGGGGTVDTVVAGTDIDVDSSDPANPIVSVDPTDIVHKTGDETIAGVKTFSSSPIVPTPTTSTQAATKDYVDTAVAGSVPEELVIAYAVAL